MNHFIDMVAVTPINTRYLVLETARLFKENDLGAMWTLSWMWGINDTCFAMLTNYHFSTSVKFLRECLVFVREFWFLLFAFTALVFQFRSDLIRIQFGKKER